MDPVPLLSLVVSILALVGAFVAHDVAGSVSKLEGPRGLKGDPGRDGAPGLVGPKGDSFTASGLFEAVGGELVEERVEGNARYVRADYRGKTVSRVPVFFYSCLSSKEGMDVAINTAAKDGLRAILEPRAEHKSSKR